MSAMQRNSHTSPPAGAAAAPASSPAFSMPSHAVGTADAGKPAHMYQLPAGSVSQAVPGAAGAALQQGAYPPPHHAAAPAYSQPTYMHYRGPSAPNPAIPAVPPVPTAMQVAASAAGGLGGSGAKGYSTQSAAANAAAAAASNAGVGNASVVSPPGSHAVPPQNAAAVQAQAQQHAQQQHAQQQQQQQQQNSPPAAPGATGPYAGAGAAAAAAAAAMVGVGGAGGHGAVNSASATQAAQVAAQAAAQQAAAQQAAAAQAAASADDAPTYVNPKQYHRILKRRASRRKATGTDVTMYTPRKRHYMHESRHVHAKHRKRGPGGRFLGSAARKAADTEAAASNAAAPVSPPLVTGGSADEREGARAGMIPKPTAVPAPATAAANL